MPSCDLLDTVLFPSTPIPSEFSCPAGATVKNLQSRDKKSRHWKGNSLGSWGNMSHFLFIVHLLSFFDVWSSTNPAGKHVAISYIFSERCASCRSHGASRSGCPSPRQRDKEYILEPSIVLRIWIDRYTYFMVFQVTFSRFQDLFINSFNSSCTSSLFEECSLLQSLGGWNHLEIPNHSARTNSD